MILIAYKMPYNRESFMLPWLGGVVANDARATDAVPINCYRTIAFTYKLPYT